MLVAAVGVYFLTCLIHKQTPSNLVRQNQTLLRPLTQVGYEHFAWFGGSTDFRQWLRHFNPCSDANGWNNEDRLRKMAAFLRGRASTHFYALTDEQKASYIRSFDNESSVFSRSPSWTWATLSRIRVPISASRGGPGRFPLGIGGKAELSRGRGFKWWPTPRAYFPPIYARSSSSIASEAVGKWPSPYVGQDGVLYAQRTCGWAQHRFSYHR